MVEGVDYSLDRADPACLYRSGIRFVARYTSRTAAKNITAAEAKALAAAGLWIVTVFETSADFMLQGKDRGVTAARESLAITNACGMPADRPHYFAYDVDPNAMSSTTKATLAAFCDGAASVLGRNRVGVYGGYALIEALCPTRAPFGWQTYAWSGGRWSGKAQIQQYQNNVPLCGAASLDRNRATAADYGQWQPGKTPGGAVATLDSDDKKYITDSLTAVRTAIVGALSDQTWGTKRKVTSGSLRAEWVAQHPADFPNGDDGRDILIDPWAMLQWCHANLTALTDPRAAKVAAKVPVADVLAAVQELLARPPAEVDPKALAEQLVAAGFSALSDADLERISAAAANEAGRRLTGGPA